MPAGRHEISASLDGEPWLGTIEAGPEDAERLDRQLQARLTESDAGKSSRPFIDFNHENGAAAAIPKKFIWADGIKLLVEWTQAGLDALRGRVYSYFSPTFEMKDGRPQAITDVGAIGGLTNSPAFQTIQRLTSNHEEPVRMNKLIAALVQLGLVADGVEDEAKVIDAVKAGVGRIQAEVTAAKEKAATAIASEGKLAAELAEFRKKREEAAEAEIDGLIKAGSIPAESRAFFIESLKRDEAGTLALLNTYKPAGNGKGTSAVKASFTPNSKGPVEELKAKIEAETDPHKRQALRVANWGILSSQAA